MSKDIKLDNFSVTFHGAELIVDSKVELSCGRRYGLIGVNGSGKSSFLAVLGKFVVLAGGPGVSWVVYKIERNKNINT